MPRWCVSGVDGADKRIQEHALTVELAIGVLRDQPGVLRALLADQHASRPPDVRDDLAQTVGVRGSDAGDIEPLLKRDAARKHSVARWVHALVLSSHRRELSRQLIIHATDGTSPIGNRQFD